MYWFIVPDIYRTLLVIALLLMTFCNSKVIAYFRKEGELASLIMGFISFVVSLVMTWKFILYRPAIMAKDMTTTMTIVVIIAIVVIFVLAVLYLPKVSEC